MSRREKFLLLALIVVAVGVWIVNKLRQKVSAYDAFVQAESFATGVPALLIQAVILTESSGRADAYRAEPRIHDASYGLMQLLYGTAKGLGYTGTPEGLYDPQTNIHYGTKLLAQLRARYGDNPAAIYSAYNSGSGSSYLTNPDVAAHVNNFLNYLSGLTA